MFNDDQKKDNEIQPGPCPIVDGVPVCPPPTEIDIIKVLKVFQECMHTQVEQVEIDIVDFLPPNGDLTAECSSVVVSAGPICTILPGNVVNVVASFTVTTTVDGVTGTGTIDINKSFFLSRAGEKGLSPQCQIFPECLLCFISDEDEEIVTLTCCVGILLLIKLEALVQLLVPTFGFAPMPPECPGVLGECPPTFEPTFPPFPPQLDGPFKSLTRKRK